MSKKPQNSPQVGDQVSLKGRAPHGTVKRISGLWVWVEWVDGGPKICHLHELEKTNEQSGQETSKGNEGSYRGH